MDEFAAVEQQPLHRGVEDQRQVVLHAQRGDRAPVLGIEETARGHRRRHQQHRAHARAHGGPQRFAVELPFAAGREAKRHVLRRAAREPDAVEQAGIGRVGHQHLVADLHRGQQGIEDAREPAGRDHAMARLVGHARELGHMARRDLAQPRLADEGQVAVVRVLGGGAHGARHGLGIGRDVDVEVLEPQEGRAFGIVGDGAHAVDADAGDVGQAGGAVAWHAGVSWQALSPHSAAGARAFTPPGRPRARGRCGRARAVPRSRCPATRAGWRARSRCGPRG